MDFFGHILDQERRVQGGTQFASSIIVTSKPDSPLQIEGATP